MGQKPGSFSTKYRESLQKLKGIRDIFVNTYRDMYGIFRSILGICQIFIKKIKKKQIKK